MLRIHWHLFSVGAPHWPTRPQRVQRPHSRQPQQSDGLVLYIVGSGDDVDVLGLCIHGTNVPTLQANHRSAPRTHRGLICSLTDRQTDIQ